MEVGPECFAGARSWPPVGTRLANSGFSHSLSLKLTRRAGPSVVLVLPARKGCTVGEELPASPGRLSSRPLGGSRHVVMPGPSQIARRVKQIDGHDGPSSDQPKSYPGGGIEP